MPVVVIFTKFDALDDLAFQELVDNGASEEEAVAQTKTYSSELFEQTQILKKLSTSKYPPKDSAFLRGKRGLNLKS